MDIKVYETQCWLNATYGKYSAFAVLDTDGITGTKTIQGLIRALQIELGVDVDGVFGDDTFEEFGELSTSSDSSIETIKNQIYILQGALYCKGQGLNPGDLNGIYTESTAAAVKRFQTYAGLSGDDLNGITTGLEMQALLNTDAYTLLSNGDSNVRAMQQDLNNKYHEYIGLIPCDGVYSRRTNRALISGLQCEEKKEPGYGNTVIDGIWGDTTMNRCPTLRRYGTVTNRNYVYILQYALYVNGYDPNGFDGGFGAGVDSAVKKFQSFVGLTSDGIVGKSTWASLLVSYGDKTRKGTACDCMKPLTSATANTLVSNGRTAVGRYLTGGSNKCLSAEELAIIHDAGLRLIPIYQTTNNRASYFSESKGKRDAYYAYYALVNFKIPSGTIVYFAVDYDATEAEVESNIIPYFKAIYDTFDEINMHGYKIGIYGPRYVCTLVREAGYSVSSFVCDMSSGFLCNIGHTLPSDWAFDQIHTLKIGSGSGEIEIDNDIASGRNLGCLVDSEADFTITESDNEAARLAKIQKILQAHNIDINAFGFGFDYERKYTVVDLGVIKASYIVSGSLITNSEATKTLSGTVVNGKFSNANFEAEINNIMTGLNLGEYKDRCIDFPALATAINYGRVRVEIEVGLVNPTISIRVLADVFKVGVQQGEVDCCVGVMYEFNLDGTRPDTFPETTFNRVKNWFQNKNWTSPEPETVIAGIVIIALIICAIILAPEIFTALIPIITALAVA